MKLQKMSSRQTVHHLVCAHVSGLEHAHPVSGQGWPGHVRRGFLREPGVSLIHPGDALYPAVQYRSQTFALYPGLPARNSEPAGDHALWEPAAGLAKPHGRLLA